MAHLLDNALTITRKMSGETDEEYRLPPRKKHTKHE